MGLSKTMGSVFVACLVLVFSIAAHAAGVPQVINYQGSLTNDLGQTVADGQYGVVFSIYSDKTGGMALWTETWIGVNSITTKDGAFSVLLGSLTAFPASFFSNNASTYLGIKVGTDAEMSPRVQISSVPYALVSGEGGVPKGGIIMWSGLIADIPTGWALCDGTNGTPDLKSRFIIGAGSSYEVGATGGNSFVSLSHSHSINNHTHSFAGTTDGDPGLVNVRRGDGDPVGSKHGHAHPFTGVTGNPSDISTDSRLSSAQDIKPPYFALAFIMKL